MTTKLPTWPWFSTPVLQSLTAGDTLSITQIREAATALADLSEAQRSLTLPSGQNTVDNRIGWAVSYLHRIGALERPQRGKYRITTFGQELLSTHPDGITEATIRSHAKPGDEWWLPKKAQVQSAGNGRSRSEDLDAQDPTEQIETGIQRIHQDVARELLTRLQEQEPVFFEHTVVELLLKMGYGGAHGRGAVTQLSHDGGIDGVIDQDALGLNKVYVQAKRYESKNSVGRREVQEFVGALSGRADGGLLITTSRFTASALDYAETIPTRIILIDGDQLANLMIRYEVGVEIKQTYNVVAIDEDFFV